MPTLHEILAFPPLGQADPYDTDTFMYYVSLMDENQIYGSSGGCYKGTQITADLVVGVAYDARREAKTAVLRFNGVPFAVVTAAGRELGDTHGTYIFDEEYAQKALFDWTQKPSFGDNLYNREVDIALRYWEGIEVSLGDSGRMTNDY